MEDLEKRYEIKYKDGNIYIDRIGKIRCKECLSEKIKVHQYRKVKLSNKIIFKTINKEFEHKDKLLDLYK